jgi:LuxR family maltose regulon positive regulatory protein
VLHHLSRGQSYAQVAATLGVSLNTVTSHVKNAYRKLDVHTAAAAVMRAVELQLLGQA